jgi:hypothetical protein
MILSCVRFGIMHEKHINFSLSEQVRLAVTLFASIRDVLLSNLSSSPVFVCRDTISSSPRPLCFEFFTIHPNYRPTPYTRQSVNRPQMEVKPL